LDKIRIKLRYILDKNTWTGLFIEKDVIKFSSQKTRDGWYSDNLLATEQRTNGHCHLTEKDFIVVWS